MNFISFLVGVSLAVVPPAASLDNPYYAITLTEEISSYNYYDVDLSSEIQEYIADECFRQFETTDIGEYHLPLVIINLIRWESGFDKNNDNGKCCGLMSVTYNLSDSIIEAEQIDDLLNPQQNIRAGIHILKNKYDEISSSSRNYSDKEIISFILEAYHTGLNLEDYHTSKKYKYVTNILESYKDTSTCAKEDLNDV